jgi:hypothetical protein
MPKAVVINITTRKPIPDGERTFERAVPEPAPNPDAMALLQMLASSIAERGADPQVVPHPDQELLGLCDLIVMLRKQEERLTDTCRATVPGTPEHRVAYEAVKAVGRRVRSPLLRAGKLRARTCTGIYAKAFATRSVGVTAGFLGKSLAEDLLECAELRAALLPAQPDVR